MDNNPRLSEPIIHWKWNTSSVDILYVQDCEQLGYYPTQISDTNRFSEG